MKYAKQIVFMASMLVNCVALGYFMKYWDPVREFFKSAPPVSTVTKSPKPAKPNPQKGLLQEAMLSQRTEVESCYDDFLRREPDKSNGSITVKWAINSTGQVIEPEVVEGDLADVDLEECVIQELRKMTFDPQKFAENTQFSYKFKFKARAPSSITFE